MQTVTPEPAFNRTRVDLQPSTVSAAVAAAARAANRVIERNLDPRSVPSPQSALAGEVIETLKAAQAGLSLAMDRAGHLAWAGDTVRRLRTGHKVAVDRDYARLEEWIRELIRDLETVAASLPAAGVGPLHPGVAPPAPAGPGLAPTGSALHALELVLRGLAAPPASVAT